MTSKADRDVARAADLRRELVRGLVAEGAVKSAEWRTAFERVSRHRFVPRFYDWDDSGERYIVDGDNSAHHDRWLTEVYRDRALFTRWSDDDMSVCSSSSMPSVMAEMLEDLRVAAGHRVLEIGTGTGYNAALLTERLGNGNVVTVDIDSRLADLAREHLELAGYWPTVLIADGFFGYAQAAPYDRLIATCEVLSIPPAWREQVKPGGLILAILAGSKVLLEVRPDGTAVGRFLPESLRFMAMRGHGFQPPDDDGIELKTGGETRDAADSFLEEGRGSAFWFLFDLLVAPDAMRMEHGDPSDLDTTIQVADQRDHSWFRLHLGTRRVTQGGPRRLWDVAEALYGDWHRLGRPGRDQFGLTVGLDGRHRVWFSEPASRCWEFPATRRPSW